MKGAIACALLIWSGAFLDPASAQVRVVRYGDDRLKGIRQVDVFVDRGAEDAAPCSPPQSSLQAVLLDTLRQNGITATLSEAAPSWFYSVVLRAESARAATHCVTTVRVELVAEVQGIPEADRYAPAGTWGSLLVGHMPLITGNTLVTSPPAAHDSRVREAIRAQVQHITEKLRAANP